MKEKIRGMDYFATIVGLRYKGSWRYQTFFGGLFTIMIFLISAATISYFANKFITRANINMSFENIKYWDPPMINLTNKFKFAVSMQYGHQNIIRKEIVNIFFEYVQYNLTTNKLTVTPLNTTKCTAENFNEVIDQYNALEIKNALCIDTTNLTIQGSNINNYFSLVRVKFLLCNNRTDCLSMDNISNVLTDMKPVANFYYIDSTYQPTTPEKFIKKFINIVDVNITFGDAKDTNVFFTENKLEVQSGWIFPTPPVVYNEIMLDNFRDLVSVRTDDNMNSFNFNILSGRKCENIYISYMEFSQFLANIGGILNNLMVCFSLVVYYVNNVIFQMEVIQDLFRFKNKESKENKQIFKNAVREMMDKPINRNMIEISKNQPPNFKLNLKTQLSKNDIDPQFTKSILTEGNFIQQKDLTEHTGKEIKLKTKEDEFSGFSQFKLNPLLLRKTSLKITDNSNDVIKKVRIDTGNNLNTLGKLEINKTDNNDLNEFKPYDLLSIYFCGCCRGVFPSLRKKIEGYKQVENYLNNTQDLTCLFKKLIEIDLMKYLLFNKDQIAIFKYLLKPEIIFHNENKAQLEETNHNESIDDFSKFYRENNSDVVKDQSVLTNISKLESDALIFNINNIYKDENTEINRKLINQFQNLLKK